MYPAGYSYVLGVMSSDSDGSLSSFSNRDAVEGSGCEYEVVAPGSNIYSALPGNRYAKWSGTSMAAPMVSAAAAILRSQNPDKSTWTSHLLMGQLVSATTNTITGHWAYGKLNITDSSTKTPKPDLAIQDIVVLDSASISDANNGDGVVQAGETVDLGIVVKNRWGTAKDVVVKADATSSGGVANPYVTFVNGTATVGEVGSFVTNDNGYTYEDDALSSVTNPIRIKVSADAPNDVQININLAATGSNGMDSEDATVYTSETFTHTIIVQKGHRLSGTLKEDTTLTSDELWIIDDGLLVPEGVTLTIEPGTQVQFYSSESDSPYVSDADAYILVEGKLLSKGTEEAPIDMFLGKGYEDKGVLIYNTASYWTVSGHLRNCPDRRQEL